MGIFNFLFGKENSRQTIATFHLDSNVPEYTIERMPTGKWGIFREGMFLHGREYTRRRDAIRGAIRAGIVVE